MAFCNLRASVCRAASCPKLSGSAARLLQPPRFSLCRASGFPGLFGSVARFLQSFWLNSWTAARCPRLSGTPVDAAGHGAAAEPEQHCVARASGSLRVAQVGDCAGRSHRPSSFEPRPRRRRCS